MQLFNLTLQSAQSITHAIFGHFSSPKAQEILVARGKILELLRPLDDGRVVSVLKTEVFGLIRDLKPFRLPGSSRDFIVIGSDSGKLIVLEYVGATNTFEIIHEEPFGKTGCRRIVPGQLLATDPKGRAVMVAALEKQKFVYTLARSSDNRLTISSPLEAHRSNTVVFATCGVHVAGFDNPVFACIEASYDDNEAADVDANGNLILAKTLVYYELDLGANTVSRLWTTPIDAGASALYSVPGDAKRPGGVLVCSEDVVSYYNRGMESLHVPLPRRFDTGDHKTLLITAGTVCNILKKGVDVLFFLLQSELGDIYKLEFDLAPAPADPDTIIVTDIAISYLDTLPPAAALCLTDTGFLFSASEFGPTSFLRITSFGGRAEEGAVTASATVNGANMIAVATARSQGAMDTAEMDDGRVFFAPRTLTHLELLSETDSLAPLLGLEVGDLAREQAPQIYALSGRGNRSRLSALRYGLPLSERLNVELPGAPTAVFTARARLADSYHSLIALSFADATIVLRGEEDMVEADDTGLLTDCPTLLLTTFNEAGPGGAAVGEGGWLQIHPGGARLVTAATGRVSDWVAPNQRKVTACAANSAQLVIALEGGDLVYLEADHGVLRELETRSLGNDPASLAIGPVPAGRQRSPFLAVGAHEKAVRVLSLEPGAIFAPLTVQGLPEVPTSLAITAADESPAPGAATTAPVASAQSSALTLYIGLKSGVLVRSTLDSSKGSLSEPRRRVLGTAPVRLHKVIIGAGVAILALSSRAWVFYNYGGVGHEAPLSVIPSAGAVVESAPHIPSLDTVASFATSSFPQGLVCTSGNALRLLSPEALGEAFSKHSLPLRYTPRRLAVYEPNHHKALAGSGRAPAVPLMAIVEADDNTFTWAVKQEMAAAVKQAFETGAAGEAMGDDATADAGAGADETKADGDDGQADPDEAARLLELQCGPPQAGAGFWGSCIRLVTPAGLQTVQLIEMADNEAALAATVCAMGSGDEAGVFVIVAVAKDLRQTPRRSHSGGSLLTYRLVADSTSITVPAAAEGEEATTKTVATGRLDFVHRTPLTDVCLSLTPFKSERMLLAGVGPLLRLYDMGKRKLLLKSELKVPSASTLTSIHVNDEVAGVEGAASLPPGPARASGSKVTVGDATSGFHTCLYTAESVSTASAVAALGPGGASATGTAVQRRFAVVATSPTPRVMSAAVAVDPLTMAGGDRFGNVFMTRLSPEDADRIDSDPTGGIKMGPLGNPVPRAPVAMTDAAQFHVGDMVTGLTLAALTPGGAKAVVYTTLMGSLGALVPVGYKEDAEFFTHLEMHLRAEVPSLVGRDHLSFRSYHGPVAHVIDGDLCAVYAESARAQSGSASGGAAGGMLTRGQVEQIAGELTCEPRDVVRKIDEIRQRVL